LNAADAGLLWGSGDGHSGQVANYQSFSKARSPRRELDRIFTNVQNSKSASLQHPCVANFGFDRTLEIMMVVWLWPGSPPKRTRCNNDADALQQGRELPKPSH
jgi:hypothetical protein